MAIDINRSTTGLELSPEQSAEVWGNVLKQSAVMQLARRIDLPGKGVTIPVITGEPTAEFVGETDEKPVSNSTFSTKTMTPYKIAVIELFSNEFKRNYARLYDELVRRLPYSASKVFDATVLNGTAPGTGFDVLTNVTSTTFTAGTDNMYDTLVTQRAAIATAGGKLNGYIVTPSGEAQLFAAKDEAGHPLFIANINSDSAIPAIMGAPLYETDAQGSNLVYAGDWSHAAYGIVDGVDLSISEEATLTYNSSTINLWQRNMFAVRCEFEVGFVADTSKFAKIVLAS